MELVVAKKSFSNFKQPLRKCLFRETSTLQRYCYLMLFFLQFLTKTQNLVKITVVVHKSSSPLRSSTIMEGKIINSLKPPLTKRASEEGYCKLNEMPRSGGCLRQKKLIGYLRWVINFWISEVKQYEKTMTNVGEGWLFCAEVRSLLLKLKWINQYK